MNKDTEKHSRQSYATKAKHLLSNKFTLEGYPPGDTREVSLRDAQEMATRNHSRMVGNGRVDGMRTPRLQ